MSMTAGLATMVLANTVNIVAFLTVTFYIHLHPL